MKHSQVSDILDQFHEKFNLIAYEGCQSSNLMARRDTSFETFQLTFELSVSCPIQDTLSG